MRTGYFAVNRADRITILHDGVLEYARYDQKTIRWHGEGRLALNDLVVFICCEEACTVTVYRYGNCECKPVTKRIPIDELEEGQTVLDFYYDNERVAIRVKDQLLFDVFVGRQKVMLQLSQGKKKYLVIQKNDEIRYFSCGGADVVTDQMEDEIMKGQSFPAYVDKHQLPIPLADFFPEKIIEELRSMKKSEELRYAKIHGEQIAVRLIQEDFDGQGSSLYMIGDEEAFLDSLRKNVSIYNRLYFNREFKVRQNELSCEVRLRGSGSKIEEINRKLDKVCHKNVTIVLTGESGTGKTFLARQIHRNGRRAEGPFVNVNCAAIAYNLIESELFGYEEGAFTGARRGGKEGYFEAAKGGTLFLDEISEMPITLQGKLLEVLQEGTFYRVGGTKKIRADIRLIVATNRNLEAMVKEGKFREDLYYRICVFPIHLPPLRERLADLYNIIEDALPQICTNLEIEPLILTQAALAKMRKYHWPGNIRELENVLEKAAVMADGQLIREEDVVLGNPLLGNAEEQNLKERLNEYEKKIIKEAYELFDGDRKEMAAFLGISKTNLFEKIHKYGIEEETLCISQKK